MPNDTITKSINKLIALLGNQNEPGETLSDILQISIEETNAEAGSIYIEEDGDFYFAWTENLVNHKWSGLYPGLKVKLKRESMAGFSGYEARELWVPDVQSGKDFKYDPTYDKKTGFVTRNSFTVPLFCENSVGGVLQVLNMQKPELPFLRQVAIFAENEVARIRRMRKDTLRILRVAALRDPLETAEHVRRVGEIATIIRTRFGEKRHETKRELIKARNNIFYAAMLHDVGKVGIADSILKKPGKLTPEERLTMEQHSSLGWQLFNDRFSTETDNEIRNVILHHHQRYDGTGYPRDEQLKGKDIPFSARIVAIADVWDALTNARCYKKAFTKEKADEIMKEGRGTQFDPEFLDLFFELRAQNEL